MIKGNFHYESEDYDEEYDDDQDYQEGQDHEGEEYYDDDQEYYEEDISDDDYIQTGPKRPNGPKEQTKIQTNKQTTIYNKTVSGFEKRLLTLFKFQKMQILQYLDFRSIYRLYISCKLIKDTLGQFLWNEMCLRHYQLYLENIKDIPENLSYYLYFFLKTKKLPYELLDEEKYSFKKPSKKLTEIRKFYSKKVFTIHDQVEPTLKELYDVDFATKRFLLNRMNDSDDFLTFCELSYDLRPKQILKITTPKDISLLSVRYLQGKIIQFQVTDSEDPDRLIFHYVHFSKLYEPYKRNIVSLPELTYAKVSVTMHHDPHYYTEEDDRASHFANELTKNNELIVTYRDFETQFREIVVFENMNLLCLIDSRRPFLAFIDYTKPALVKLLALKELRKLAHVATLKIDKDNTIQLEDVTKQVIEIQVTKSNEGYSFTKQQLKSQH